MWELIKRQTMIAGLIILLFFVGIFIYYQTTTRILDNELEAKALLLNENVAQDINAYFSSIEILLETLGVYIEQNQNEPDILEYMVSLLAYQEQMTSLYFLSVDNEMINASGFVPPPTLDMRTRSWYILAVEQGSTIYTDAFLNASQDKIIVTIARPIYINDVLFGVLAADVDTKTLSEMLIEKTVGDKGYVFLLDRQMHIIAHPETQSDTLQLVTADVLSDKLSGLLMQDVEMIDITLSGISGVLFYQTLSRSEWVLGVFIPDSEFYSNTVLLFRVFLILIIALLLMVVIILYLFRNFVSKPMLSLEEEIKAIRIEHHPEYRLTLKRKGGFLQLRHHINRALELSQDLFNILSDKIDQLHTSNQELETTRLELNNRFSALKVSEDRFRNLITEMQQGLAYHKMIYDDHGKPIDYTFIYVNESFEQLTGLLAKDIIGKTVLNVLPETESYWIEIYGEVTKTKTSRVYLNYSNALGKWFEVVVYSPSQDYFATIITDVTDRKRLEDELNTEYQRFSNLVHSMEDVVYELDLDQKHTALYGRWLDRDNLSKDAFIGKTARDLFEEESALVHENAFNETLNKGRALYEWSMVTGEDTIYFQTSLSVIKNKTGEVTGVLGVGRNITNIKKMEKQVFDSEKRYQLVTTSANVGVWEYNHSTNQLWCSAEYFSLLGYTEHDFDLNERTLDRVWLALLHPDDVEDAKKTFDDYVYQKKEALYENYFRMKRKDGNYAWILSRGQTLRQPDDPSLNMTVGIHLDMTEQFQKQEEIEYLNSHDFLTNLYNRRWFSEALRKCDKPNFYPLTVMMMDLNGLKLINDAFGHVKGDEVLQLVADTLGSLVHKTHTLARMGGDEFALIMTNTDMPEAEKMKDLLTESVKELSIQNVPLSLSIGYEVKTEVEMPLKDVLKNAEDHMYKRKILEGQSERNRAIQGILKTLTDKYEEEKIHSERVSRLCGDIGVALQLREDDIEELKMAGLLHDIGKISIPDHILDKPSALNEEEYDIIKKHTTSGYQILRAADAYSDLAEYAVTHHERVDGTGYPNGLKKDEIPLFARIISVADAYEAMTSNRPYRKALGKIAAIQELKKHAGTQFDQDIVQAFIEDVLHKE